MAPGVLHEANTPVNMPTKNNGLSSQELVMAEKESHATVLKTFRLLISDLCQQFEGGHPGGAIGHTCIFQYEFLHLTGYKDMTFDQLKSYHSERYDALCPGPPEIEHEGIEVTTGPLGQGIANAVGLAMASKHLAATFNRPGLDMVSNHTWCMIGDACLQEGVGLEAVSLAGHFKLNNLTVIYDNNQITCDGSVDMTNTENINNKMRASGWDVLDIQDGCYNIAGIVSALEQSKKSPDKPTFINVRTVIGLGSKVQGTAVAHGAAFGAEDVAAQKRAYGFDPDGHFVVGQATRDFFAELPARGEERVREWEALVARYAEAHPELAERFWKRVKGDLAGWEELIPKSFPEKATASRASSGLVFNPIAKELDSFMVGTADLSPSVNMIWPGKPDLRSSCGIDGNYGGRYIHYGVREHAMCAIWNGLAAFSPGTIVPVTSSFFMFYLYAAPAVRMGALMRLQVIHHATHDSIGMGEDGPTHQPIELAALYRAMPNLLYIRPGDSEETAGAWAAALAARDTPTVVSTSRHALPQRALHTRRDGVRRGAYVLEENEAAALTLIGVGAELAHAVGVARKLREEHGVEARVVSFPCQRLFEAQPLGYRRATLRRHGTPAVVLEPYAPNGWERYADAAACVTRFGHSLPGTAAYRYFGFDVGTLTERVLGYLEKIKGDEMLRREFVEI
ncbi:transketolase [Apiospora aurea]|uniref:Transketolase n=1 Tax=Apiospora aurea TaxID=335848 RepID=A0ABR1QGG0_9PEZI